MSYADNDWHDVRVDLKAGTGSKIYLDGQEFKAVRSIGITKSVHEPCIVTLEFFADPVHGMVDGKIDMKLISGGEDKDGT